MEEKARSMEFDTRFKTMMKYKYVAAKLLKAAVDDFRVYTIDEIIDGMIAAEGNKITYSSKEDKYVSEVKSLNPYSGDAGEKNIIHDLIFDLLLEDKREGQAFRNKTAILRPVQVQFTVDFEMQQSVSSKYSEISRGIYYAASMLRDTVHRSAGYEDIHKVYSIWVCSKNCIPMTHPEDPGQYYYRHSYRILRTYRKNEALALRNTDEKARKVIADNKYSLDEQADIMEVVFIELPKQLALRASDIDELNNALNMLFDQPIRIIEELSKDLGVPTGSMKNKLYTEVIEMKSFDELKKNLEEIKNTAVEEAELKGKAAGIISTLTYGDKNGRDGLTVFFDKYKGYLNEGDNKIDAFKKAKLSIEEFNLDEKLIRRFIKILEDSNY